MGQELRELGQKYSSLKSPFSFSGRSNVLRENKHIPRSEVLNKLYSIHSYTSHREAKKPATYNPVFVRAKRKLLQTDLLELAADIVHPNGGVKYLLMIQDTFSRKLFVKPMKNKQESTVTPLFREVLRKMGPLHPECQLLADKGREYNNRAFKTMLEEEGLEMIHPSHKAPHVERSNLSLQRLIFRFIEDSGKKRFIDRLDDIVSVFNNRYHRIIKMSANEAERDANRNAVLANQQIYNEKAYNKMKKIDLAVGDMVKLHKYHESFHRGYNRQFTNEIYVIDKIHSHLPIPMFDIRDMNGELLEGKFYANELQVVKGSIFKVEKVLQTRTVNGKKQWLVKWLGFPDSHNSWVDREPK